MMIIEMREAAFDKALEKLDEAKHHAKQTKLTLCELEDAMYDCYETIKDKDEEEYEDSESMFEDSEDDIDFRKGKSMRRSMRRHHYQDEDDMDMRSYRRGERRSNMRRRRDSMGRYM